MYSSRIRVPQRVALCGQEGHYAAQCTGQPKVKADEHDTKEAPVTKKPFIFLDVAILREYLEIELNVPNSPFHFDIERAIDDWVLLISRMKRSVSRFGFTTVQETSRLQPSSTLSMNIFR